MPKIEIGGRSYIPIQEAARESGWSPSYLGRLARRGALAVQIIAGMWFFDREHFRAFVAQRPKCGSTKP